MSKGRTSEVTSFHQSLDVFFAHPEVVNPEKRNKRKTTQKEAMRSETSLLKLMNFSFYTHSLQEQRGQQNRCLFHAFVPIFRQQRSISSRKPGREKGSSN